MAVRALLKFIILVVFVNQGICENYMLGFNEGLNDCDNFDNKVMKGDNMVLGKATVDGEDAMYLEGHIEVIKTITDGDMFEFEIAKETEVGSEPMYSCAVNVCKSLEDKNAPWAAAFEALEIYGCPIEVGKYYASKLTLDLSSFKDKMNPEFEGTYQCVMKILDSSMNDKSCHTLGIAVKQVDERK